MNKHFAWAALGAAGVLMGCGGGGTTSTGAGGGATSTATSAGGGSGTSTAATGAGGSSATSTATASGTGTGAGGGGPGAVCTACVGMKDVFKAGSACEKSLMDCNADADCDSWFKCVQNCEASSFNPACFESCNQSAAVVAKLYQPIYNCTCAACKVECAPACP